MTETELPDGAALIIEIERNMWETWSNYGRAPGCTLHDKRDAIWFETPMPMIPYNGVLKFQVTHNAHVRIETIVDHFTTRNVPYMWTVHPSSLPPDLPRQLEEHGLKDVEPLYGMARSLSQLPQVPPLPRDIEVRKVADERDVGAFYQFAAWRWNIPEEHRQLYAAIVSQFRFGMPDSKAHMWQAWHEGQPIAKAGMYLGSGSAGIYAVVTKPEARRLGLARILTLTALHMASDSGYQLAVLHSTPMAEALYESIGFSTLAEFRLFASEDVHV
jgi:ribosomal protein S18 acetylase RimI-like enzyme